VARGPATPESTDDDLSVTLYRALGPAEVADVAEIGGFRVDPTGRGYETGKLFTRSYDDASAFAVSSGQWEAPATAIATVVVPAAALPEVVSIEVDGMVCCFVPAGALAALNEAADIRVDPWP
jgi:hypothetical protein